MTPPEETDMEQGGTYNRVLGRLRVAAVFVVLAALLVLSRPTPRGVSIGFLLVAAGGLLRLWAAGHLLKTVELVTSGPYRYTRNPLYLGRLLVFSGLCVMARLPYHAHWFVLAAGWIVFFAYYMPRKERVEPARLRKTHGAAYERYSRAVPALFPSPRPYPEGASIGWSSDRMLRNREHWMALTLVLITLLLLWRAYDLRL
jgi:protein-S-isoprenylcysteine O-methyltransferase Ste14